MKLKEIISNIGIADIVVPIVFIGVTLGVTGWAVENTRISDRYHQVYNRALVQYADTNKDGLVSTSEQEEFSKSVISRNGAVLDPSYKARYKDGARVSTEVLTEWFDNYRPLR